MQFKKALLPLIIGGFFLSIDQMLKWFAFNLWSQPILISPYFGWELFLNRGAAFGIPVGNKPIIFFTFPIIMLLCWLFLKETKANRHSTAILFGLSLILSGAISNLFDRIIRLYVIDYFLIGTAVINIADLLIVIGLILYSLHFFHHKHEHHE